MIEEQRQADPDTPIEHAREKVLQLMQQRKM